MKRSVFLVFVILAAAPSLARAVDRVWTGGSGNWMDASHWDPFGVPVGGDRVFVTATDSLHKVITFNDTRQIAPIYNSLLVDESGPGTIRLDQPGNRLFALALTVGLGGPGTYRLSGGTGGFGVATVNPTGVLQVTGGRFQCATFTQNGTVHVSGFGSFKADDYIQTTGQLFLGQGAAYEGVNFTSNAAGVRSVDVIMNLTGAYHYNAGVFDATPAVGTLINGGVSCATFNFNHPSGTFGGSLEVTQRLNFNLASITIAGDLLNRGDLTIPAGNRIIGRQNAYQIGGSVVQTGSFNTPTPGVIGTSPGALRIGGGAIWTQNGGANVNGQLIVGGVGGVTGGGTYILNSGTVGSTFGSGLVVGHISDGTFVQNAGTIHAAGVIVGGAPTASFAAERGFFVKHGGLLDGGTLGTIIVGRDGSVGGAFTQNGGLTTSGELILNEDSTSHGVFTLAGGTFTTGRVVSHGTFNQTGGVATIAGNFDGAGSLSVTGDARMTLVRLRQNALHVGGTARIAQSTNVFGVPTHRVSSLTFENGPGGTVRGHWDLFFANLVVDYAGASPINDVKRYIASGYAGGSWNGTGLVASPAANTGLALGYAEAADVLGPGGGTFKGVFADATSILVAYVRYGDANLDGVINLADFNRLAANFGGSNRTWAEADFTYDGIVNLADFNRLAASFGLSATGPEVTPQDWSSLAAAVPEPAVGLAALAAMARGMGRRNRSLSAS